MASLFAAEERLPETATAHGAIAPEVPGVDIDLDGSQMQPLSIMARGWVQGPVIDLLQGAYSQREEWGRLLRPWKVTAVLFLAVLLVGGTATGLNYYRLTQQEVQLRADIDALFRKTLPQVRRIVNPRAQMEQRLKQLQRGAGGADADFLGMFAETASVVRASKGISVTGASYRDGRLDLELQADNLQLLDRLKQALVGSGRMNAEIQSATSDRDQKVTSRIRIEVKA
jgi:general secretion pathway protein L